MENTKETPLRDLMKDALDHYNEAGNAISHHRNDVYLAIEQYYKLKMITDSDIETWAERAAEFATDKHSKRVIIKASIMIGIKALLNGEIVSSVRNDTKL